MKSPTKAPMGLMIEVDDKPAGKKPMGESSGSDLDAALGDAFDAYQGGNRQGFIDAMSAAISAKCAEMYAGDDDSADEES